MVIQSDRLIILELDAIKAVLEPEQTDYMYFIADVYGDGTVYFASTYEEHCENIDKYLTR